MDKDHRGKNRIERLATNDDTRSPQDESAVGGNEEKVNVVIPAEAGNQVKVKD